MILSVLLLSIQSIDVFQRYVSRYFLSKNDHIAIESHVEAVRTASEHRSKNIRCSTYRTCRRHIFMCKTQWNRIGTQYGTFFDGFLKRFSPRITKRWISIYSTIFVLYLIDLMSLHVSMSNTHARTNTPTFFIDVSLCV